MAQIDATGLDSNFTAFDLNNTDHHSAAVVTPNSYEWQSTNGFYLTALSFAGDITASPSGTINAVNIVDSSYNPVLNITGLDLKLIDIIDTGNAGVMQEKFWNNVLAGNTTILAPTIGGLSLSLMGDFVTVTNGDSLSGGNDTFSGSNVQNLGVFTGDAILVGDLGVLHGGDDLFDGVVGDDIIGDVGDGLLASPSNYGTVFGGDDTVTIVDPNYNPQLNINNIIGDVDVNSINGVVKGGNDDIILVNLLSVDVVAGDAYQTFGADTGGNDTIRIETTIAGRPFTNPTLLWATTRSVDGTGGAIMAKGGAYSITSTMSTRTKLAATSIPSTRGRASAAMTRSRSTARCR